MVNVCYTMTCDHCCRYLMFENQTVAECGDLESLLACADRHGWLLKLSPDAADPEPRLTVCAHCAKKQSEG